MTKQFCGLAHQRSTCIAEAFKVVLKKGHSQSMYTRGKKEIHPYYISPIEIGLTWAKITYLKIHSIALAIGLQTGMN